MPPRPHNTRTPLRERPFVTLVNSLDSNTTNNRETLIAPTKGTRIRLIRARVIQEQADGRHLWELYFGTGADITTDPTKAIDILEIANNGTDSTRTYPSGQGPRAERDEVLSSRWLGTAPVTVHKINVEYTEEP